MKLVRQPVMDWAVQNLSQVQEATIAVAYFRPTGPLRTILEKIPLLRIIVSDEFHINDPDVLRDLSRHASVRVVPSDAPGGKLHAKVIHCRTADGHSKALIGSANLTYSGLSSNNEVCVALDSHIAHDEPVLHSLTDWLTALEQESENPDWDTARKIYSRRKRLRLATQGGERSYWVLKTTEGFRGRSHWPEFLAEGVVAIGWSALTMDPIQAGGGELHERIKKVYAGSAKGSVDHASRTIRSFCKEWKRGDLVIVCRGYPMQATDVWLYGFARVESDYFFDAASSWWRIKRRADIQIIDERLPKDVFTDGLQRGSLLQTIHSVGADDFRRFCEVAESRLGIVLEARLSSES